MAVTYGERTSLAVETGGSIVEAVGGIAVIVLAIIGLAQATPSITLTAIAVIVLGAALLAEGSAVATEFARLLTTNSANVPGELGGGMAVELLGGAVILVLGILALLGVAEGIMMATAILVGGGLMMLGAGTMTALNEFKLQSGALGDAVQKLSRAAASGAAGVQLLIGITAMVLGILALVGAGGLMLTQAGLLVLGASLTISASAFAGSLTRMFVRG